jgi:selenocysteine-specific translation elongation factor
MTDSAPENVDKLKAVLPKILAETSLKNVEIICTSSLTDEGFTDLKTALTQLAPKHRDANGKFKLGIEAPIEGKSGFTSVVGVIDRGSVKKYDKTFMMPWGKEFIVQEIKVEGLVSEKAHAGQRADILYKGLNKWDVQQGDVVAAEGSLEKGKIITADFEVSKFFKDELRKDSEVLFNIGMQTLPVTVTRIVKDNAEVPGITTGQKAHVTIETKVAFAFEKGQHCIIYNPEAHWKSIKVVGAGKIHEGTA